MSLPPEAAQHTEAGAKAFAKFYLEQVSDAFASLDTQVIAGLATDGCRGCRVVVTKVERNRASGQHTRSRSFTAYLVAVRTQQAVDTIQVDVAGTERSVDVIDSAGTVLRRTGSGHVTFRTAVVWKSEAWRVADFKVVTP